MATGTSTLGTFAEVPIAMNLLARDDGAVVPGDAPQRCTVARYGQRRRADKQEEILRLETKGIIPQRSECIAFEPGGRRCS